MSMESQLVLRMQYEVGLPSGPDQVLGLDFERSHLTILGALLDILHQLLLLILQLYPLTIQLALRLLKSSLMFSQSLGRRHSLAKGPFYDLACQLLDKR